MLINDSSEIEESSVMCPYIGMLEDASTCLAYPSILNHCCRCNPRAIPDLKFQARYCLNTAFHTCPVFLGQAGERFPAEHRLIQNGREPAKRNWWIVLAGVLGLALIALLVWLLPLLSRWSAATLSNTPTLGTQIALIPDTATPTPTEVPTSTEIPITPTPRVVFVVITLESSPTPTSTATSTATPTPTATATATRPAWYYWTSTRTRTPEPPPTNTPTPVITSATPLTPSATPVTPSATPVTPSETPVTPSATPVTPSATPVTPSPTPVTPTAPPIPTPTP